MMGNGWNNSSRNKLENYLHSKQETNKRSSNHNIYVLEIILAVENANKKGKKINTMDSKVKLILVNFKGFFSRLKQMGGRLNK